MALNSKSLKRIFVHKELRLDDPDPSMSVDDVLKFYSNTYSELTVATVSQPEIKKDEVVYTFKTTVGTKG